MNGLRDSWRLAFLIFVGALSWSWTMVKSGLPTAWGLGFWGANGHDGIWHLALIEATKKGFPINNPLFSGTALSNYHWGFDLLVAVISRLTGTSASLLYFQIFPPLVGVVIGVLTYLLIKKWTGSSLAARWAVFFTYFGGSFGWLVTLWRGGELGGESLFWAQQAISTLINPPFALSLVFLTGGFYLVLRDKRPKLLSLVCQIMIFGFLFMVKSYAGVVGLVGLTVIGIWRAVRDRELEGLVRAGGAVVITVLLIFWLVPGASGLLTFEPFWFPRTMVEARDRLFIPRLAEALNAYLLFRMYVRVIAIVGLVTAVFVVGNLGTRILAFFYAWRFRSRGEGFKAFDLALVAMVLVSVGFPLLLVQKGTAWNTIQFFYYGQVFLGWLAGVVMARVSLKGRWGEWWCLAVILLTVPTSLSSLWYQYIPPRPPAALPYNELAALLFLKQELPGTVLVYPYERPLPDEVLEPPVSLSRYDSTAYVSAYSGKPSYLADSVNLAILGIAWKGRLDQAEKFFKEGSPFLAMRFLKDNHIRYVYLVGSEALPGSEWQLGVSKIYDQAGVRIYQVQGT